MGLDALLLAPMPLEAKGERLQRQFFEGRLVIARLDMPCTEDGVDIYPGTSPPLDYPKWATHFEVDSPLGPPARTEEGVEGEYRASVPAYDQGSRPTTAEFVEAVAVRIGNSRR